MCVCVYTKIDRGIYERRVIAHIHMIVGVKALAYTDQCTCTGHNM